MVTRNDLELYDRLADSWWDARSAAFRSLHRVKAFHLAAIAVRWGERLAGRTLVDLGCGGGLLAIPLAERDATVIGIDRSRPSLQAARTEALRRGIACRFVLADLCATPLRAACADLVVLSDVIEHVEDPAAALAEAARLLVPGGQLFVNTINRTLRARLLAVTVAEGLGFVPRGTHDPRLFVRPRELRAWAQRAGLRVRELVGEAPRLLDTLRSRAIGLRRSRDLGVAYSAFLVKEAAA